MNPRAASVALSFPALSMADETGRLVSKGMPAVDLGQWTFGLVLVLASIGVMAYLLRRLGSFSRMEPERFKVLAALSLGARERVVLVQAGEKQLVLGVAPGRVQTLCILEGEDVVKPQVQPLSSGTFGDRLAELLPERKK